MSSNLSRGTASFSQPQMNEPHRVADAVAGIRSRLNHTPGSAATRHREKARQRKANTDAGRYADERRDERHSVHDRTKTVLPGNPADGMSIVVLT